MPVEYFDLFDRFEQSIPCLSQLLFGAGHNPSLRLQILSQFACLIPEAVEKALLVREPGPANSARGLLFHSAARGGLPFVARVQLSPA